MYSSIPPDKSNSEQIHEVVRKRYAEVAKAGSSCCGDTPSCCGDTPSCCCSPGNMDDVSARLGYSDEELAAVPEGANLGLGCGNPQAIADLKPGEVVLDLGCGAGFDVFLAARQVGPQGHVIGVDMTADMLAKARANAQRADITNVEFRLGEIEHLPVPDGSIDVIISNCVINLSPDKPAVFKEAFRVLRPGGRLAVSDVVATAPLPESWREDMRLLYGCISGAAEIDELERMLSEAGFVEVDIQPVSHSREFIREWQPGTRIEDYVLSAAIQAVKPR